MKSLNGHLKWGLVKWTNFCTISYLGTFWNTQGKIKRHNGRRHNSLSPPSQRSVTHNIKTASSNLTVEAWSKLPDSLLEGQQILKLCYLHLFDEVQNCTVLVGCLTFSSGFHWCIQVLSSSNIKALNKALWIRLCHTIHKLWFEKQNLCFAHLFFHASNLNREWENKKNKQQGINIWHYWWHLHILKRVLLTLGLARSLTKLLGYLPMSLAMVFWRIFVRQFHENQPWQNKKAKKRYSFTMQCTVCRAKSKLKK